MHSEDKFGFSDRSKRGETMQKREPTQEEIEEIINNQKERYNEQLEKLYRVCGSFDRLIDRLLRSIGS